MYAECPEGFIWSPDSLPRNAVPHDLLSMVQSRLNDEDLAETVEFLEFLMKLAPYDANVYLYLAMALNALDDLPRAELYSGIAATLDENCSAYAFYHGLILLFQKKYNDARRFFARAARLKPEAAENYLMLGDCYTALGDKYTGMKYYHKTIQLDSWDCSANFRLGIRAMYEGDIVPAIRYFRKCLKHDDSFITAYQYLMRIYYAFGKIASARRIIRVALVFYPDYIDAELDLMALRCLIGEERGISAVTAYLNKHRDREDALNKRIERLKQDVEIITRKNAQKKSLKRARF